jgi:Domain of Unknown Function (DUF1543)
MSYKLFMILLGCKPTGRNTEQHDIFFGIAKELKDLVPQIKASWKNSGKIHLDAFRTVTNVDGYAITIKEKTDKTTNAKNLFFLNLGGYKENHFDEFHYKMLIVASEKAKAIQTAKQSAFFIHTGFGKKATSHIDDKYGVDVDDIFDIKDILSQEMKDQFSIEISAEVNEELPADEISLGYYKIDEL